MRQIPLKSKFLLLRYKCSVTLKRYVCKHLANLGHKFSRVRHCGSPLGLYDCKDHESNPNLKNTKRGNVNELWYFENIFTYREHTVFITDVFQTQKTYMQHSFFPPPTCTHTLTNVGKLIIYRPAIYYHGNGAINLLSWCHICFL